MADCRALLDAVEETTFEDEFVGVVADDMCDEETAAEDEGAALLKGNGVDG